MADTIVLSLGGSIIAPDSVDHVFLQRFKQAVEVFLAAHPDTRLILTTGGGAPARTYQNAYRTIVPHSDPETQDWLGIAATRLNAALVKAIFASHCSDPVVVDPTAPLDFTGRILVAAGWKPGFSTDTDAVLLAKRFGAKTLVNLSNIAKVYSADPRIDKTAVPIDTISWVDFRSMVGDSWTPGKNVPFDPVASRHAQEFGLQVICADGRDIPNTIAILEGKHFNGTVIG